MSKKTKIIIISILLLIFIIVIAIIAINKTKPVEEETTEIDHNYAINETKDTTEDNEEEINLEENKTVYISDKEITHLERLTPEQYTDKESFYSKLHNRVKEDETSDKKVVTEEISDISTKYQVYVHVTFSDGSDETYVVSYDATSMHSFLRCVSLEEWNSIQNGENAG